MYVYCLRGKTRASRSGDSGLVEIRVICRIRQDDRKVPNFERLVSLEQDSSPFGSRKWEVGRGENRGG